MLSSSQDNYVPFESARIETGKSALKDETLQLEMASAITHHISASCVYKIDVNFVINEKTISDLIGRTAHIMMIDSPALFKILIAMHPDAFV